MHASYPFHKILIAIRFKQVSDLDPPSLKNVFDSKDLKTKDSFQMRSLDTQFLDIRTISTF